MVTKEEFERRCLTTHYYNCPIYTEKVKGVKQYPEQWLKAKRISEP